MTAITSLSLHELTGGSSISGVGMSGPQVVEGWHGAPYTPPLRTTPEYVAMMRAIFRVESAVSLTETLPASLAATAPPGSAKRCVAAGGRPRLPVYAVAIGPRTRARPEVATAVSVL